jgi:type IV pilus assembly protein PilV
MSIRTLQRGTSLIEVLIAAIIIGIGLLGISALQMKALQFSTNAEHRAKATDIAWALADRMRANLPAGELDTGTGNYYVEAAVPACPAAFAGSVCSMAPDAANAVGVTQCSEQEMAAYDLWELRCSADMGAEEVLPAGTLAVTCNDKVAGGDPCDPGSELTITVTWETRNETLDTGSTGDFVSMTVIPGADIF